MLELLLKLLDKIKELSELKEKRKEKIFEKLIEPTYHDLELIHQDYLESFTALKGLLPSVTDAPKIRAEKCQKALEFLEARRVKCEGIRSKVGAFNTVITRQAERLDADSQEFLKAVVGYITPQICENYPMTTLYTFWMQLLHNLRWVHETSAEPEKADLEQLSSSILASTRESWTKVSTIFARIRLQNASR